ncbi:MAG: hypothetical protein E7597_07410 [Ruminococcaceae bacterium]|nr:hypothetical protein [Oscillospiraceae bacterium]
MKRALATIMLFALVLTAFTACGSDGPKTNRKNNTIIGTWEGSLDGITMTYSFKADGTGKAEAAGATIEYTWTVKDGKLNAVGEFMGETTEVFQDADYKLENGKLIITQQGTTVEFTRKGSSSANIGFGDKTESTPDKGNSGTAAIPDVQVRPVESTIIGTWEVTQDEIVMTFTFDEGGTGKIAMSGITMDMTWSTSGGKLNGELSFMGESEQLFSDADYSISGSTMTVTQDGETLIFTKK